MGKRKVSSPNIESSSSSDDIIDESYIERHKREINTFLSTTANLNLKKKQLSKKKLSQNNIDSELMSSFLKKEVSEDEEGSLDSENEHGSGSTTMHLTENVSNRKSKKLKKEYISSDNESSQEQNVSTCLSSPDRNTSRKSKIKLKKQEKRKAYSTDLPRKDKSDSATSDENGFNKKNNPKQITLRREIKREVLSDDAESNSDSDSHRDSNKESVIKNINETVVKDEVQSNSSSSSDSENEESPRPRAYVPQTKFSTIQTPVTILQDIRLTPKSKSAKEKLKEMYPGLKPIEVSTELEFSDSDEIHLFRIPKNVDPKKLKNAEINLEEECKVNIGEKYVITPTTKVPDPTLVIFANSKVLLFKNNIKMEKYIKSKKEPEIFVSKKELVPLPCNLKKRHPLFGSDFQNKIQLSDHVEKKLDEAIANLLKRERKSKKKKNKKTKHEDTDEKPNQDIFNLLNTHTFLTSHDRIKKEASDDSAFGSSSSIDKVRGKKKDKGYHSDKSVKQEMENSLSVRRKEKKKKSKHSYDRDMMDVSGIKKEIPDTDSVDAADTEEIFISPKKKKKHSSIINSTLMSDIVKTPSFSSEISTIVSESSTSGKKSKKSKKDKLFKEDSIKKEELISQLLNDVTVEINYSKKIKKEF